ncbi:uncharacterized protein LOC121872912 [Homarus americanus]|uniref:uncharacterized protein LOC121872912 n=1 Tax=Homarus americanus TaxID=6706 RepID=UPI001C453B85|nr:uncharacterized protein LOC121872912 [Homarus americanus]
MQVVNLTLLGAVIACVSAFPVMFLAYTDGRADTQRAKLLDCAPPTGNSPPAFRCRPVNERSPQKPVLPSPENLPILEIIEEDLEGMTVVEVNDGRLEQRPGQERLVVVEACQYIIPAS